MAVIRPPHCDGLGPVMCSGQCSADPLTSKTERTGRSAESKAAQQDWQSIRWSDLSSEERDDDCRSCRAICGPNAFIYMKSPTFTKVKVGFVVSIER